MKITCDHPASKFGLPVILDDSGEVMDYAAGIKAVREKLGMSTQELADACGVSKRTVEGWEQGRTPDAAPLNLMSGLVKGGKRKPAKA